MSSGFGHGSVGKNGFQMLTVCLLNKEKWKLFGIHLLKEFQGVITENNFLLAINTLENTPISGFFFVFVS